MERYIDADKLQKDGWKLRREKHGLATSTFETMELDCVPAADVRKNVKGEWIDCGIHGDWAWEMDGHGNSYHIWECSKCEYTIEHRSNYCPNCGAQMKEGDT